MFWYVCHVFSTAVRGTVSSVHIFNLGLFEKLPRQVL